MDFRKMSKENFSNMFVPKENPGEFSNKAPKSNSKF